MMPLRAGCEETIFPSGAWQALTTRPVQAITGASAVDATGARTLLGAGDYAIDIDAQGTGLIMLLRPIDQRRLAVRFTAGLAPTWEDLPDALRHGIMRLAAHQHRAREGDRALPVPPAAVAALWRPWRRMRLA